MHSLFSRARTTSQTARTSQAPSASDEFGRVGAPYKSDTLPPPLPRKDKDTKDKKDKSRRQRTISIPKDNRPSFLRSNSPEPELPTQHLPPLQTGGFLPRYIPSAPTTSERDDPARHPYGYLHTEKDVILSLEDVHRLLAILNEELTLRGLSTPLLFSTQALDVSAPRVRNLIRAFLGTCSDPVSRSGDARFREEARFAGPHELAMTIRWGLARIVRMVNGVETHGFMDFDVYRAWRNSEESQRYPPDHFASIIAGIPPPARPIFTSLFTLLSRLVAYSTTSGLTPSTLAGHFGPLIFGLVPATASTFSATLIAFHRAAHATEHLLLAHIRWEDDIQRRKTPGTAGLPSRLKEWIRGYPSMLPRSGEADLDRMRRGARTVRVASVRRNVRLYSPDLVQSAATWAGEGDLSGRAEWLRVVPKHSGLQARYTDSYRKRLDIPVPAPDSRGPSSDNGHGNWLSSETSSLTTPGAGGEDAKYSSLTDMRWGEFEALGFGGGGAGGKIPEFDLNEGARQTRLEKRTTMTWNDFSSAGFLRDDTPLSDTLQFARPLQSSIQTWPTTSEDIHRKLKKQQKVLPTFGWETTPVAGQEWIVEEAFLDCWADLIWSSGWSEREERTHRDSNWALIDFKALPPNPSSANLFAQSSDPRTSNQWFVFEEFVPREYRDQLTNPKKKRNALGFSVKPKQWKPATTLNGKPYTSGMAPHSPGFGASDFDAMLKSTRGVTRKISAGDDTTDSWHSNPPGINVGDLSITTPTFAPQIQTLSMTPTPTTPKRPAPSPRGVVGSATKSGGLSSRFRIGSAKRGNIGSEYDPNLDFETRTASEGSDGSPDRMHPERSFGLGGLGSPEKKHGRKQSKDDAWVDILVADQGRRMRNQDATFGRGGAVAFPTGSSSTLRRGRATSDPDIQQQHQQHRMTYDEEEDYTMGTAPVPVSPPVEYRSSDEEVMPVPQQPSPDPAAHIQLHPEPAEPPIPGRPSQETRYEDDPEDYEPESDFEPTSDDHHGREEDMTTQSFAVSDSGYKEDDPTTSSLGQPISPKLMPRRAANGVSSLIDMYAERDAQAQTTTAKPSRLPIRTTPKAPSPEDDALVAPPIPPALEPGRASPSRYVHGAPLHNVLEEDDDA